MGFFCQIKFKSNQYYWVNCPHKMVCHSLSIVKIAWKWRLIRACKHFAPPLFLHEIFGDALRFSLVSALVPERSRECDCDYLLCATVCLWVVWSFHGNFFEGPQKIFKVFIICFLFLKRIFLSFYSFEK